MSDRDEAMRILGARDGYIGAMLKVRQQISKTTPTEWPPPS